MLISAIFADPINHRIRIQLNPLHRDLKLKHPRLCNTNMKTNTNANTNTKTNTNTNTAELCTEIWNIFATQIQIWKQIQMHIPIQMQIQIQLNSSLWTEISLNSSLQNYISGNFILVLGKPRKTYLPLFCGFHILMVKKCQTDTDEITKLIFSPQEIIQINISTLCVMLAGVSGARKCIDLVLGVPPVWGLSPRGPGDGGGDLDRGPRGGGGGRGGLLPD